MDEPAIDDQAFLQLAIDEAVAGVRAGDGRPFGAVIVRGGAIVVKAHNSVILRNDPTAHAEMEAIRAASRALGTFDLTGCDLYSSCEPCPMCLGATLWSRVDRLFFAANRFDAAAGGFDDAALYDQLAKPMEQRERPKTTRLPLPTLGAPFEAWVERNGRS